MVLARLLLELHASRVLHPSDWASSSRTRAYTAGGPAFTMAARKIVAPLGFNRSAARRTSSL
eukprot:12344437-Heterocapsa_arctica.AAC.1